VVDDEQLAREELCYLLGRVGGVEVVGQAANGIEAIRVIEQSNPDLVMLDIQMPGLTGFEVARRLLDNGVDSQLVFVTAFDRHAIEAFEINAVDYLLKPVERERLAATLERARERETSGDRGRGLAAASAAMEAAARKPFLERIPVRKRDDVVLLPVRQIVSIVAEGELLHLTTTGNERYTIAHRLNALEARLDPRRFVRLGRGALAAVDHIQRVSTMPGGTYQVTLANGQVLPVSRLQSRVLRETLLRL
jgi:DNA-binding LytR/AlgR family response regulator